MPPAHAFIGGRTATLVPLVPSPTPAAEAVRELAFVRGEASTTDIYVVREDGRGLKRLTTSRGAGG